MATAAPNQNLPLLYSTLEPLNSNQHGNWKIRRLDKSPNMAKVHAVPATVEEFPLLQRHFPWSSRWRQSDPARADGAERRRERLLDEEGVLTDRFDLRTRLFAPLPVPAGKAPSRQRRTIAVRRFQFGRGRRFRRREPLFDGDQPSEATRRSCSFASSSKRPGSAPLHSWTSFARPIS
jgi:hypothetical protein